MAIATSLDDRGTASNPDALSARIGSITLISAYSRACTTHDPKVDPWNSISFFYQESMHHVLTYVDRRSKPARPVAFAVFPTGQDEISSLADHLLPSDLSPPFTSFSF